MPFLKDYTLSWLLSSNTTLYIGEDMFLILQLMLHKKYFKVIANIYIIFLNVNVSTLCQSKHTLFLMSVFYSLLFNPHNNLMKWMLIKVRKPVSGRAKV